MFSDLPPELLSAILDNLIEPPATHLGTLTSLAGTSRLFYSICLPHVYQNIIVRDGRNQSATLLATLYSRPELAALVEEMTFDFTEYYSDVDAEVARILPVVINLKSLEIAGQWRLAGNTPFWKSKCGGSETLSALLTKMASHDTVYKPRDRTLPRLKKCT